MIIACMLAASACDGTDATELELAEVEVRECKAGLADDELLSGGRISDYDGLHCVAWNFDDRGPAIDLLNHEENCGFGGSDEEGRTLWEPAVYRSGPGALELRVEWAFEASSACGSCLHDFSVELADALSADDDLELTIATRPCNAGDCTWTRATVELPLSKAPRGVVCEYVDWRRVDPSTDLGRLHTPPRDGTCDDGLAAASVGRDRELCLAACEDDGDCPLPALQRCEDGVCKLQRGW